MLYCTCPERKDVIGVDFCGLQKLTLLDFPGHMACTVFTGGCNLRCPFCHNGGLVLSPEDLFSEEEVLSFLKTRKGILEGICVTGGEPLLHPELESFLIAVKELGYPVKLDTNGTFPQRLKEFVEKGLVDYVAMDVKNCREKYGQTVGLPEFDLTPVEESVSFLLKGTVPYEFRTTVVRELHTEEDIEALTQWIAGAQKYALQSFVDSGAVLSSGLSAWDKETLCRMAEIARKHLPNVELRGV